MYNSSRVISSRARLIAFDDGKVVYRYDIVCFILTFLTALACLAISVLGPICAAVILFLGVVSPTILYRDVKSNRNIMIAAIMPLMATLSILWSKYPDFTAYYTFQLYITFFLAVSIASMRTPGVSLNALLYAHLLFGIVSLLFGRYSLWENGEYVFIGLSSAKNSYGEMNFFMIMLGVYAVHKSKSRRSLLSMVPGVSSLLLGITGLLYSKSAGALVAAAVAVVLYCSLVKIGRLRLQNRAALLGLLLFAFIAIVILVVPLWDDVSSSTLQYFGKSKDLTGRTELWAVADRLIEREFWLGLGQYAFWVRGDPMAEALWAINGIQERIGFNFHNTFRELLVHLGVVGTVIYISVFIVLFLRQLNSVLFIKSKENYFYFCIIFSYAIRAPFESLLPLSPVNTSTIFILIALTFMPIKKYSLLPAGR